MRWRGSSVGWGAAIVWVLVAGCGSEREMLSPKLEGLLLPECGVTPTCAPFEGSCDYDGCAGSEADADKDCIFRALADSWDGTPAYVEVVSAGEGSPRAIYALGDGTALVEGPNGMSECQLRPPDFFEACVGNDHDDACYAPLGWSTTCNGVDPSCPGD